MRRRDVLAGAGLAAGASFGFPAPAIAQDLRQLTMVTDWPEGPGMLASAKRLARTIRESSGGRIAIDVTASGQVVRPFETFDAVQAGLADMFHTHIGYFEDKSPAFQFYSGLPFGFTPNELIAWVRFGGGQELWDELGGRFDIKPLLGCSPSAQMGGWFLEEIASTKGFKGLRYRMAGLGGEVFRRLGATVVLLAAADIVPALESGAIDACEWVGPWLDMEMGLHRVASHYYYPGWHEPGAALTLGINKRVWEGFDEGDRQLIEAAAAGEYAVSLAEFNANNALALSKLRADETVHIHRFDDAMLRIFAEISKDVVAAAGAADALAEKIFRSYSDFRSLIGDWSDISVGANLAARALG
jgi:TRAP-type mannitol/chloroaromatic compound transport system substrate-binding protein